MRTDNYVGFSMNLLSETHYALQTKYGVARPWQSASVTGSVKRGFGVQIITPGQPDHWWHGRAFTKYEAREQAWREWMRKQDRSAVA